MLSTFGDAARNLSQDAGYALRGGWFEADLVVDGISEPLLAAEVSLRRLDADMTEQKLDLLKFPACFVTRTGGCKILWC